MARKGLLKTIARALGMTGVSKSEPAEPEPAEPAPDLENPFPDIVVVPFRDVLDLHSIPPRQVRAVVEDYIDEAHRRRVRWVRIIHGKGIGVQREAVRSVLSRASFVIEFKDAPAEAGGWGATLVTLDADQSSEAQQ